MKSLGVFGAMIMVAVAAAATPQYTDWGVNIEKKNSFVQGGYRKGSGWQISVLQDSVLSLNKNFDLLSGFNGHMASVMDRVGSGAFTSSYVQLGYFTYDAAAGKVLTVNALDFGGGDTASAKLTAGDTLGLWLEMADGTKYSSVNIASDEFTYKDKVFGGGDSASGKKLYNFGSWYTDSNNNQLNYEQSVLLKVSGTPLPGVLMTLLIGGAVGGLPLLRRKYQRHV